MFKLRRIALLTLFVLPMLAYAQPEGRFTPLQASPQALEEVYETARGATVRIETTPSGIGSGFVIAADGLVRVTLGARTL